MKNIINLEKDKDGIYKPSGTVEKMPAKKAKIKAYPRQNLQNAKKIQNPLEILEEIGEHVLSEWDKVLRNFIP